MKSILIFNHQALKVFLSVLYLFACSSLYAIGGDDPIGGIDIIVKKDPSSRPVVSFSLNGQEIKKFNGLKMNDRVVFLSTVMAKKIVKSSKKGAFGDAGKLSKLLAKSMGKNWCGPCRMEKEKKRIVHKFKLRSQEWKEGISAFITAEF